MGKYEKALKKTLTYSSIFKYPLSQGQLWRFLIWEYKEKPVFGRFIKALSILIQQKKVYKIRNYYLVKNNRLWVTERERQSQIALKKIAIARKASHFLFYLPFVELIGLTGKLALGIANKEDDLDLLVVTKTGTLWLSRLLMLIFLSFAGLRRKPGDKQFKDKICLNMLIGANYLKIPKNERDLFCAHELAQMRSLFERNNSYQKLLEHNSWVSDFLPNIIGKSQRLGKRPLSRNRLLQLLNDVAMRFQTWYMRKKRTTEVVKEEYVRFHPQDVRKQLLSQYDKLIKSQEN